MIPDIWPKMLNNTYRPCTPRPEDPVLRFDGEGRICVRLQDGKIGFPACGELPAAGTVYLFSVDERPGTGSHPGAGPLPHLGWEQGSQAGQGQVTPGLAGGPLWPLISRWVLR